MSTTRKHDVSPMAPPSMPFQQLQSKMENLAKTDIEEYYRLRGDEAKLKKAEDILQKMILILLHDLGVKVARSSPVPDTFTSERPMASPAGSNDRMMSQQSLFPNQRPQRLRRPQTNSKVWIEKGKTATELRDDRDIETFLKDVTIADIFGELRNARGFKESDISKIEGEYVGDVIFDDSSNPAHQIKIVTSGTIEDGKFQGSSRIELSKNGQAYSTSVSDGKSHLKAYMGFANDDSAIVLEACGGDCYLQLYYLPQIQSLAGLFYKKASIGSYERQGTVRLKRL